MQHTYKIMLQKEPEGGYTVVVPALPGCITYGENEDEAITNSEDAIDIYIEELQSRGEPIPVEEKKQKKIEDFIDVLIAESRKDEPKRCWDDVKRSLHEMNKFNN